jgi:hypothetical protein
LKNDLQLFINMRYILRYTQYAKSRCYRISSKFKPQIYDDSYSTYDISIFCYEENGKTNFHYTISNGALIVSKTYNNIRLGSNFLMTRDKTFHTNYNILHISNDAFSFHIKQTENVPRLLMIMQYFIESNIYKCVHR